MAPSSNTRALGINPKIPVQIPSKMVAKIEHETNGPITTMPATVHTTIFEYLDDPADMTALALACKAHANMYNDLGSAGIIKTKLRSKYASGKRLEFFRRLITWKPMIAYRLCTNCQYFRPICQAGWTGNSRWYREKLTMKDAKVQGSRCSSCALKAEREISKIRRLYKKRK